MGHKIEVKDRHSGKVFEEKIFGEKFVRWAHENSLGIQLTSSPWIQKIASKFYGIYASSRFSRAEISRFLEQHDIKMEDFIEPDEGFSSFNEFFSRRLKPGARSFKKNTNQVCAPAEGRVFYSPIIDGKANLVIKGKKYEIGDLIGEKDTSDLAHAYVIRLCPVDYHRYHFGFGGKILKTKKMGGKLFSVNPMALNLRNDVFWENHREIYKLETSDQRICYQVEVGAICVGTMIQNKREGESFVKGEEKGTFRFGGSTCILLLPKRFVPEPDIVENSGANIETFVRVGESLGKFF